MLRGVFFISPCVRRWWCCSQRSDCLGWSRRLANSNCSSNIFLTISGPVSNSRCFRDTNTASSRTLMMNSNCEKVLFFADVGVNRAVEKRTNEEWLFHAFNSPEALLVPVLESKSLIHAGKPALVSTTILSKDAIYQHERDMQPIFLGLKAGTAAPIFTVDVKKFSSTDWALHVLQEGMEWVDLRKYGPELEPPDAGLLAYACGMVHWHSRNRFCGCCGKKMLSELGGHSLKCISHSCTSSIYPRLDPAIIGLVTFGDYVLLGRQARWEQGRYSLLAGFVEVGETFELALAREVKEECGVDIDGKSVRYAGSQPWPFPSSLMVGFTAKACSSDCSSMNHKHLEKCEISGEENVPTVAGHNSLPTITVDTDELEDARWIHKDFLRTVLSAKKLPHGTTFTVPGRHAIAHILMESWISSSRTPTWAGNDIPTVEIDEGVFKYVLFLLKDGKGNQKLVVRGNCSLPFHADILEQTHKQVRHVGLQVEPRGGGRIEHNFKQQSIHVYGFSQAYGQADHTLTSVILKQWLPLHRISVSWEGY